MKSQRTQAAWNRNSHRKFFIERSPLHRQRLSLIKVTRRELLSRATPRLNESPFYWRQFRLRLAKAFFAEVQALPLPIWVRNARLPKTASAFADLRAFNRNLAR